MFVFNVDFTVFLADSTNGSAC